MIWLAWTILALAAAGVAVLGVKSVRLHRESKEMLARSQRDLAEMNRRLEQAQRTRSELEQP